MTGSPILKTLFPLSLFRSHTKTRIKGSAWNGKRFPLMEESKALTPFIKIFFEKEIPSIVDAAAWQE